MSLLTKALAIKSIRKHTNSEPTDDMIELAVAYAKHEITANQAAAAMEVNVTTMHSRIRHALFSAIRSGKLVLR